VWRYLGWSAELGLMRPPKSSPQQHDSIILFLIHSRLNYQNIIVLMWILDWTFYSLIPFFSTLPPLFRKLNFTISINLKFQIEWNYIITIIYKLWEICWNAKQFHSQSILWNYFPLQYSSTCLFLCGKFFKKTYINLMVLTWFCTNCYL